MGRSVQQEREVVRKTREAYEAAKEAYNAVLCQENKKGGRLMEAIGTILTWVALAVWGLSAWYVMALAVNDSFVSRPHQPMSLIVLFVWPLVLVMAVVMFPIVVGYVACYESRRARTRRETRGGRR